MICDACGKNEAMFHSKTNINGKVSEFYLCDECLNQKRNKSKEDDFDLFEVDPFFTDNSLFGSLFNNGCESKNVVSKKTCPNCGCDFNDFSANGLLGCAKCYDYFKDRLMPIVSNMQFGTKHVGKSISKPSENDEILVLRKQLRDAVEVENYELASKLKKKIDLLEAEHE